MSNKHLDEFLDAISRDAGLRAELHARNLTPDDVVALADGRGFHFTVEEFRTKAAPLTDDEWSNAARKFGDDHADNYILFLEEIPMSKEALNAFFKKVAEDEALQKKLVEFAAAQGFEFSSDELNDSDLDGVAGGLFTSVIDYKVDTVKPVPANTVDQVVADQTTTKVEPDSTNLKEIKYDGLGR